jgi:hypothetical protein
MSTSDSPSRSLEATSPPGNLPVAVEVKTAPAPTVVGMEVGVFRYHGPHFPPEQLEAFEKVVPGAAKQLFEDTLKDTALQRQLLEQESRHRHLLEDRQHAAEVSGRRWGQICFTVLGASAIGAGVFLASPAALAGIVATVFGGGLLSRYVSAESTKQALSPELPQMNPKSTPAQLPPAPAPSTKPNPSPRGKRKKK